MIRLINEDGSQYGLVSLEDAEKRADEIGLDLVEVAPGVYKTLDQGRLLYAANKARKSSRQRTQKTKEVQFSLMIGENDFQIKMKRVLSFLEEGDRVKVVLQLRSREQVRAELIQELLARIKEESGVEGGEPSISGRTAIMVLE